jgi:hypothetical protein
MHYSTEMKLIDLVSSIISVNNGKGQDLLVQQTRCFPDVCLVYRVVSSMIAGL